MLGGKATLGPGPNSKGSDIEYELSFMLITVMGTGTRFFTKLLLDHYRKQYPTIPKRQIFYAQHCIPMQMDTISDMFAKGTAIITTVRDWDKARESCGKFTDPSQTFDIQKGLWDKFIRPNASVIVSVDDSKESRLTQLNDFLNTNITTDWKPIGANPR